MLELQLKYFGKKISLDLALAVFYFFSVIIGRVKFDLYFADFKSCDKYLVPFALFCTKMHSSQKWV